MSLGQLADLRTCLENIRFHSQNMDYANDAPTLGEVVLESPENVLFASLGFAEEAKRFPRGRDLLAHLAKLGSLRDARTGLPTANVGLIREQASYGKLTHLPAAAWLHGLSEADTSTEKLEGALGLTFASEVLLAAERVVGAIESQIDAHVEMSRGQLYGILAQCRQFERRDIGEFSGWVLRPDASNEATTSREPFVIDTLNGLIDLLPPECEPNHEWLGKAIQRLQDAIQQLESATTEQDEESCVPELQRAAKALLSYLSEAAGGKNEDRSTAKTKATTKRRRKRSGGTTTPRLTARQTEAMQLHGECEGNIAEVARRMGVVRKTAEQHVNAAFTKLGKSVPKTKARTSSLTTDKRGQTTVAEGDQKRR